MMVWLKVSKLNTKQLEERIPLSQMTLVVPVSKDCPAQMPKKSLKMVFRERVVMRGGG